jgi:hypothetical protein
MFCKHAKVIKIDLYAHLFFIFIDFASKQIKGIKEVLIMPKLSNKNV